MDGNGVRILKFKLRLCAELEAVENTVPCVCAERHNHDVLPTSRACWPFIGALIWCTRMIVLPCIALAMKIALVSLTDAPLSAAVDTPHLRHHRHSQTYSGGSAPNFDFYVYSMTYQPEFCRESSNKYSGCHHPSPNWAGQLTIHGLWPQRFDGTWPSECTAERLKHEFYRKDSDTLLPDLEEKWPNVKADVGSKSHTEFWEHEWDKHGTCSGLLQYDYFSSALHLLLETPSVVKHGYGTTVHKNELLDGYGGGTMAALVCKSGYLSEVRACFEKQEDGMPGKRMECPQAVLSENSCGEEIEIASFEVLTASVE